MNDTFDIKIGDEDREILMSFGLLNELTRFVGDPGRIGMMAADPDMRSEVLKLVLAKRKRSGKVVEPLADADDIDANYRDIEALLRWSMEHVLAFFIRLLRTAAEVAEKEKAGTVDLLSSLDGSPSSPSPTE